MINIEERLLAEADEQELYLLLNVARHMDKENFAFPSNKTLAKLTGWGLKKVRKVKGQCIKKSFFETSTRFRPDGGQTSDGFTITTDAIGIFVNLKGKGAPPPQDGTPPRTQKGQGPPPQDGHPNEVLFNLSTTYTPIVSFLNELLGTRYSPKTKKTQTAINARIREGATIEDFEAVIRHKVAKWKNDAKMAQYLRPETLFGTKFEGYLNDAIVAGKKQEARHQDIELAPEVEERYKEYIEHVSSRYPNVTQSIAYLSKAQFATLKKRQYANRLTSIGNDTEKRAFNRAHARWENGEPEATRFPGVWEYFLNTMNQIIESALTI